MTILDMRRYQTKRIIVAAVVVVTLMYFLQLFHTDDNHSRSIEKNIADTGHSTTVNVVRQKTSTIAKESQNAKESTSEIVVDIPHLKTEIEIYKREDITLDDKMEAILKLRLERLNQTCSCRNITETDQPDTKKYLSNLIVSDKYKVIFCSNDDIQIEGWRKLLRKENDDLSLRLLSSYREESISYRLKYYYKLLLVRHPLIRLMSAYKSWIKQHPNVDEKSLMNQSAEESHDVSLQNQANVDSGMVYNLEKNSTRFSLPVDFFANIVDGANSDNSLDPLWGRISMLCQACNVQYDYISKSETAPDDATYLLSKLMDDANGSYTHLKPEPFDAGLLEEFRTALTAELANNIYKVYQYDFEMFGYPKPWD
ncbi:carbohydrate sulfotransferase 11-like [Styela clava]